MKRQDESPKEQVQSAADSGMFAMMAMMLICCLGIFLLAVLIPLLGWPVGIALAIAGGAALMYMHGRLMNHGSHH